MTADSYHTYTFDAEGNLTAVDGGTTAQYVYDALNHRVRTVVGSALTDFVFNANGQRVSVWSGSTHAELRGQYYWGGKPLAFYTGGATYFQHQDWLGTERTRTTYNGGVEATFTSLAYGDAQTTASGTDLDPYHYATLDHDAESGSLLSGTDHAQFRQYSDTQGNWLSPDPYSGSYDFSNPQSFNRYAYVENLPVSVTDPAGLKLPTCIVSVERNCPVSSYNVVTGANPWSVSGGNYIGGWYWQSSWQYVLTVYGYDENGLPITDGNNGQWVDNGQLAYIGSSMPTSSSSSNPGGGGAPNNGTPQQPQQTPQQPKQQPWYCGTGILVPSFHCPNK